MLVAALYRGNKSLGRNEMGKFFNEMSRILKLRFLLSDYKLQIVRVANRFKQHMKCKALARVAFEEQLEKGVREVIKHEADFISMNSCFEVSPFLTYLNEAAKNALFELVFNEYLFGYLKNVIDEKLILSRFG